VRISFSFLFFFNNKDMPLEDVSVSLSRLALAKAIKTPDGNEQEAEPWSKSVIFHQPHINQNMRNTIVNPQSNGQARVKGNKYQNYRPQQHQQQQQQQQAPPMIRARSNEKPISSSSSSASSFHNKSSKYSSLSFFFLDP
jgi:hypothetical protein